MTSNHEHVPSATINNFQVYITVILKVPAKPEQTYRSVALINSSVTRKKGQSQNGCYKKTKHAKFSEKQTFLTPWYAHVDTHTFVCVSGGKKCLFFRKFSGLCFVVTPVLRFPLLPYPRRNAHWFFKNTVYRCTDAKYSTVSSSYYSSPLKITRLATYAWNFLLCICLHRKIFKACLTIFQHHTWKSQVIDLTH